MTDRRETDVLDLILLDAPPLAPGYELSVLRGARRRRRARRLAALAGTGGLALVVATGARVAADRAPDRTVGLVQSPSPTAAATSAPARVSDETAIQAAAVRALADRVAGGYREWTSLFILDHRFRG